MPVSVHVQFVVHKVALGQVSLRVLRFSRQYHSTKALYLRIICGMNNRLVGGRSSEKNTVSPHRHEQHVPPTELCIQFLSFTESHHQLVNTQASYSGGSVFSFWPMLVILVEVFCSYFQSH
jgi:hypothetical protein